MTRMAEYDKRERTNERTNENLVDADTSHTTYGDT